MTHSNVIPFRRKEAVPTSTALNPTHPSQGCSQETREPSPLAGFDLRPFLPKGESLDFEEASDGTYQVPHKLYEFCVKVADTKIELKVFLCLMRFSMGFHRSQCEAGLSFVSRWTGLDRRNVHKAIEALLVKGLIVRVTLGKHFDQGSIYEIPIVKAYLDYTSQRRASNSKTPPSTEPSIPQKSESLVLNQQQYCSQNNNSTVVESPPKKDNSKKTKNINHTPLQNEFLDQYFQSIKQNKKRNREWQCFEELQKDQYTLLEIAEAVDFLLEEGVPQEKSDLPQLKITCHFPMAFLLMQMDWVLKFIPARREKLRKREERKQIEAARQSKDQQEADQESTQYLQDLLEFQKAFPTQAEQERCFREFSQKHPILASNKFQVKTLTIKAWAASKRLNSQT